MKSKHADSVGFAVETAQELAEPLPTPPQRLGEGAMRYWAPIVNSKRRTAWTESDLLQACQLARDYDAVETLTEELERDGHILTRESGSRYANPASALLDKAARRIILASRALQVHAIATTGKTDHQGAKNEAARQIAQDIRQADSTLIPRLQ